ncbi:LOW QUALITY PROTEIN: hypothetical protein Cgig2_018903 [Carnegiea gigantea]|uniref:Uncharacterized protein n=1 Tax=Carnegiea gigantea TaxID=171969 RepID=A0A9Q1K5U6_9CARY|nr:LOW QUALITY PROTEIN: hypothetical protein Cgig2_018903 [Carnegiea gigantea]
MVAVLKNLMSTMTDTIMQQATEHVKKAIEAMNFASPYLRPSVYLGPLIQIRTDGPRVKTAASPLERAPCKAVSRTLGDRRSQSQPRRHMQLILDILPGSRSRSRPRSLRGVSRRRHTPERRSVKEHSILKKSQPMTTALKPHNTWKYYEFHEHNGHTTAEYRELRKALYKVADKRQIDCLLKRGP